ERNEKARADVSQQVKDSHRLGPERAVERRKAGDRQRHPDDADRHALEHAVGYQISIGTSRLMLISHRPEITCRPKPMLMPMRGSSRPINMATKKPIVAPAPRPP